MDKRIKNIVEDDGELVIQLEKGWRIGLGLPVSYQHSFRAKNQNDLNILIKTIKVCRCHSCLK